MENFDEVSDLENFFKQSETFKNNKPFKYAFVEEFFKHDFYEKLFETYPKYEKDDGYWSTSTRFTKHQLYRGWGKYNPGSYVENEPDPKLSPEWNKFFRFLHSDEFLNALKKFSGVAIDKMKTFRFMLYHKGGFQLPHIHNDGPSTLIVFFYFSKGWEKGDPGGTYVASEEDESKIVFEPYNLDNSAMIFHDGPFAAHGVRRITDDVERRGIQIYLEEYSTESGWSGDKKGQEPVEI